jgi:soluble lytic murein transglycosylase
VRIAASIDDTFPPDTDVSRMAYKIRDDYTSLMWLGGTKALDSLGSPSSAAPLFYRYGAAAQTPQTRAKGFYWAGRAAVSANDRAAANRYFEMAAAHPTAFYGILALERLGRPVPRLTGSPSRVPTREERAAFNARPITAAVREVARGSDWQTTVRFFREISDQAKSESDHLLVAELAASLGRRDLGVILGQAAHSAGLENFEKVGYPLIPPPPGSDWTMVHAIARQESQFAMNAISHAGARGLMQLMPGTAREQAGKIGLSYESSALLTDANYNIRLGDGYFARMMDMFGGSYPLAVAAYNAGPGNVLKWLRSNGDPRRGSIDWIDWIEKIPLTETRNYVQRVLENAVVYEAMNPERARYKGPAPMSHFIGKRTPG